MTKDDVKRMLRVCIDTECDRGGGRKKRLYRQSRPKKTRCIAEVQNGEDKS